MISTNHSPSTGQSSSINCDPGMLAWNVSQEETWISSWKTKLEKARAFRDGAIERGLPGIDDLSDLVKELEDEYTSASWDITKIFPHERPKVNRVKPAFQNHDNKRRASLLKNEVQPEDVVPKPCTRLDANDDDEDYERSMDPLHPINTNYTSLFDWPDDNKALSHLTLEEIANHQANASAFDPSERQQDQVERSDLIAWGLETDIWSTTEASINDIRAGEIHRREQIEKVTRAFWEEVNNVKKVGQADPTSIQDDPLMRLVPDDDAYSNTTSRSHQCTWTAGPSEIKRAATPTPLVQRNSRPTQFDRLREAISQQQKHTSIREYYQLWLQVSRERIKGAVGPEGARIFDPAKPKN
ncbi:hypothetical protein N0V90_006158 [Kalmusia sp. IMI 367209]|nr:hypothetical protein N0V90_006158 [Kalmusia sp. IMI 367209]